MLAELIVAASDPGCAALLGEFDRRRAVDRRGIIAFTDRLVRLFADPRAPIGAARDLGLLLFDVTLPAKRALSRISWGFGAMPRLARGLKLAPAAAARRLPMRAAFDCDVAVVGSGLAGACAAALLARRSGLAAERVVLIDSAPPVQPAPSEAAPEVRVVAVSRASERILRAAQAWDHLRGERLCPYEHMRVWHESSAPDSRAVLSFDAADLGQPNLGYIAENSELQAACLESFRRAGGRLLSSPLRSWSLESDAARLQLESNT